MYRVVRTTLVVSILVLTIAYVIRPRFPDTASNHWLKTLIWAYLQLIDIACKIGQLLGLSQINIVRWMFDILILMDRKMETVEEYITEMDGVEVTIFKPAGQVDSLRPGIVHYHGGGWALYSPAFYAPVCRTIVEQTQSILVSVNYRKAPENPFPVPVEDCLKATRFLLKNAGRFDIDPNRIGIKGDSAGGNIAMAVAVYLAKQADPDLPSLKFLSLDYPALQAFDFDLPSYKKHATGPGLLKKKIMIKYWLGYAFGNIDYLDEFYVHNHTSNELKNSLYANFVNWDLLPDQFAQEFVGSRIKRKVYNKELADKAKDIILDPLFAPLMASDEELSLLPPTYITNAEFDVLRDDGFLAAKRLRQVGIEVEHSYFPAEEHGFLNLVLLDQNALDEFVKFSKWFKQILK